MSRLARRWFGPLSDSRRTPRRAADLRARLLLVPLEPRLTPAPFTVSNTNDAGAGSLRQALLDANAAAGADTIVFDGSFTGMSRTISLTSGQLLISDALTVSGTGANLLTVRRDPAAANFRVLNIDGAGVVAVTLSGLTISGGRVAGQGGGIRVANENLTVTDAVITGNTTAGASSYNQGAGIAVGSYGTLTVRNTTLSSNTAARSGGGLFLADHGTLLVENCTISGNSAVDSMGTIGYGKGGGIDVFGVAGAGGVTIRGSTITGNGASSGGGLACTANDRLLVENCTITGNSVARFGGGVYFQGPVGASGVTVRNNTIGGNTANFGGGLYLNFTGTLVVENCTITGNSVAGAGGGVAVKGGGLLTVRSTTIAGNTAAGGNGGGFRFAEGGSLLLENSTVSGNSAGSSISGAGGGGYFRGAIGAGGVTIRNSTISGNTAFTGGGLALWSLASAVQIHNSTIANNTATATADVGATVSGGGISLRFLSGGSVNLITSIVAGNDSALAGTAADDLEADAPGAVTATFSAIGSDPGPVVFPGLGGNNLPFGAALNLQPLANTGGPTLTHALGAGSAAINHGANPTALNTDQRGGSFGRVLGLTTDIGAWESAVTTPAATGSFANVTANGGTSYSFQVTYRAAGLVNAGTIGAGDVRVTGPNGFNQVAAFVIVDSSANGLVRVATYSITPPGGSWDGTDYGAYTVAVEPNQVADTTGAFVPAGGFGAFRVLTPTTFTVVNADNAGDGSLRQAILDANAHAAAADTIVFDPGFFATPRTIVLTTGTLTVTDPLTVTGPGFANLTVSGNNATRPFTLDGPGSIAVTLSGLAIVNGRATGDFDGGGIYVGTENLTLFDAVVGNNQAPFSRNGGGIAVGAGDGLAGALTVRNSIIGNNLANMTGGGLFVSDGSTLLVENTILSANTAATAGGIFFAGAAAPGGVTIRNSTISGNSAFNGGGVRLQSLTGDVVIQNCTITNNTATTTIAGAGNGGGGLAKTGNGTITLTSTILSGNSATLTGTANDDLVATGTNTVTATFSAIGADPGAGVLSAASSNNLAFVAPLNLQPLALNGGPSRTHALGSGSAAINTGSNPAGLSTDQRGPGFLRSVGQTDIGAFEVQPVGGTPPRVTGVQSNGGATQRSMVLSLQVTFSTVVALPATPATAFTLTRISDGTAVSFTASATVVGGVSVVTLTNFAGAAAANGSLADGRYTLTALAAQITASGLQLDGNGDGTGGDNFVFADSGASTGNQLFRLFGDATGDRVVNAGDLNLFRAISGATTSDFTFDSDRNGVVNAADLNAFRSRFGAGV